MQACRFGVPFFLESLCLFCLCLEGFMQISVPELTLKKTGIIAKSNVPLLPLPLSLQIFTCWLPDKVEQGMCKQIKDRSGVEGVGQTVQGYVEGTCESLICLDHGGLKPITIYIKPTRFLSNPSFLQAETHLSDLRTVSSLLFFPHLLPITFQVQQRSSTYFPNRKVIRKSGEHKNNQLFLCLMEHSATFVFEILNDTGFYYICIVPLPIMHEASRINYRLLQK